MDTRFARVTEMLVEMVAFLVLKMCAVVVFSPIFLFPAILVAVLGGIVGKIFMKAQLSVKREMSNAKAPVLGHFGAAISGISECSLSAQLWEAMYLYSTASIRAYGVQDAFKAEAYKRIDKYSRAAIIHVNLNRFGFLFCQALLQPNFHFTDGSASVLISWEPSFLPASLLTSHTLGISARPIPVSRWRWPVSSLVAPAGCVLMHTRWHSCVY